MSAQKQPGFMAFAFAGLVLWFIFSRACDGCDCGSADDKRVAAEKVKREADEQAASEQRARDAQRVEARAAIDGANAMRAALKGKRGKLVPPVDVTVDDLIAKCGKRPEKSDWDGSVVGVKRYVQSTVGDPDAVKIEGCTTPGLDVESCWVFDCKVRGKNGFGGMVMNAMRFGKSESGFETIKVWQ